MDRIRFSRYNRPDVLHLVRNGHRAHGHQDQCEEATPPCQVCISDITPYSDICHILPAHFGHTHTYATYRTYRARTFVRRTRVRGTYVRYEHVFPPVSVSSVLSPAIPVRPSLSPLRGE